MNRPLCHCKDLLQTELYCKDCGESLCYSCYKHHPNEHKGIVKLDEHLQDEKTLLERELKRANLFRKDVDELATRAHSCHANLQAVFMDCSSSIKSFDTVIKKLEAWKSDILEELKSMKERELSGILSSEMPSEGGIIKKPILHRRPTAVIAETVRKLTPVFIAEQLQGDEDAVYETIGAPNVTVQLEPKIALAEQLQEDKDTASSMQYRIPNESLPPTPADSHSQSSSPAITRFSFNDDLLYEEITSGFNHPSIRVIKNSDFEKAGSYNISFSAMCVNSHGVTVLSDSYNSCLRILEGDKIGAGTIKLNGSPTAIAFSNMHGTKFHNGAVLVAGDFQNTCLKKVKITEYFSHKTTNLKLTKNIPLAIASGDCNRKSNSDCCYIVTERAPGSANIQSLSCNGSVNHTFVIGQTPNGMAYHNGYLVICDRNEGRLLKISTSSGQALWDESVKARQKGIMAEPHSIAILPKEQIAVSDAQKHSIYIFSEDGELECVFGKEGDDPGEFRRPTALAVRQDQDLIVVDSLNNRIQICQLTLVTDEQFETTV